MSCFKASETLLGIETAFDETDLAKTWRFKASETLLGIETDQETADAYLPNATRFKASETLLGIETALPEKLLLSGC